MKVFHSPLHAGHSPERYAIGRDLMLARETPDRVDALLTALRADGHELHKATDHGITPLCSVHSADYLDFLRSAHARLLLERPGAAADPAHEWVVASAFPNRHMHALPGSVVGQAGHYLGSTTVPVGAGTWPAVLSAAHCAIDATDAVLAGDRVTYALCRPPGHHAYADLGAGFCYVNNAAVAADRLARARGQVAVIDIDVHHGNGTQGIFWQRSDVQYISVHADPDFAYPYYAGRADEIGEGAGRGYTLNLPLPLHSRDEAWLQAIEAGVRRTREIGTQALVVSLGFDAWERDPFVLLGISTAGFEAAGRSLGALRLPTVLVQEGGYAVEALGPNLQAFLGGFFSTHA